MHKYSQLSPKQASLCSPLITRPISTLVKMLRGSSPPPIRAGIVLVKLSLCLCNALFTTLSVLLEQRDKSVNSLTPPAYRGLGFQPFQQPRLLNAPGSFAAVSVLVSFPAEPGWQSAPTMKLLKSAVIFVLVPTLTPAFDPLSASIFAGSAVMAWHLLSSDSWLKCSFQECCKKNGTVNFTGKEMVRAHGGRSDAPSQGDESFL